MPDDAKVDKARPQNGQNFRFEGAQNLKEAGKELKKAQAMGRGGLQPAGEGKPGEARQLQQRREKFGVSYINVAQRSMAAFAPVVAQLAGT